MSMKQRYMEFLKQKGKMPASYGKEQDMMSSGMDDEEWSDGDWNDHESDDDGYACGGMVKGKGYAQGGMVEDDMKKQFAMALMKRSKK
jgi:hypothetical protein